MNYRERKRGKEDRMKVYNGREDKTRKKNIIQGTLKGKRG